ncbi:MAG: hypothetical protein AVDCRST_MAG85-1207, partial [uncultured Solirubrobacteraceae bacterium]
DPLRRLALHRSRRPPLRRPGRLVRAHGALPVGQGPRARSLPL